MMRMSKAGLYFIHAFKFYLAFFIMYPFFITIVFVAAWHPSPAFSWDFAGQTVSRPVIEVMKLVRQWSKRRGFALDEKQIGPGSWKLMIHAGQSPLILKISPDSPLASRISPCCGKEDKNLGAVADAWQDLLAFIRQPCHEAPLQEENGTKENDFTVQKDNPGLIAENHPFLNKYKNLIVCIMMDQKKEPIQMSGMYLPDLGVILTTAHEINEVNEIVLTCKDGRTIKGDLANIDSTRDLTLIKVAHFPVGGPSPGFRHGILKRGEEVAFIGCPFGNGLALETGRIEVPRNMGGQILWQVQMDIEPGSSGSPVFDRDGCLVGLIKGRLRGGPGQGFIIPIDTVRDFLNVYKFRKESGASFFRLPIFRQPPPLNQ